MSFTHPKLDLISAPLSSFYVSAPFLGGGRWTPADVRGARGGELRANNSQILADSDPDVTIRGLQSALPVFCRPQICHTVTAIPDLPPKTRKMWNWCSSRTLCTQRCTELLHG
jgi:hypothetical protein